MHAQIELIQKYQNDFEAMRLTGSLQNDVLLSLKTSFLNELFESGSVSNRVGSKAAALIELLEENIIPVVQ